MSNANPIHKEALRPYGKIIHTIQPSGTLASRSRPGNNDGMEYVPRPELDAKLETIETRMDGRIARIEDRFEQIDKRFEQIDSTISSLRTSLQSTKNAVWYAAATVIATFIAVVTVYIAAFDSGRDTVKMAVEAQTRANQARQETAAALSEIRQIVADMRAQSASPPNHPSE